TVLAARSSFVSSLASHHIRPFGSCLPALDLFPSAAWSRVIGRAWRNASPQLLAYGSPAGYLPLREAIAAHVGAARGVRCDADQVVVVNGSQQALFLIGLVLLRQGDTVLIEEPGYPGARVG